jgi:phage antirepressor YoqD-like protein
MPKTRHTILFSKTGISIPLPTIVKIQERRFAMLIPNKQTMTSREIADYAEKQHAHVLEAIRNMEPSWEKVSQSKFRLAEYIDEQGKKRPQYELTKTECLFIATKFNDEARAKLVLRWEKLETESRIDFTNPATVVQLAQNWLDEQNKRLAAEKQVKALEAKTELMDRVLDADEKIDIGQAAKILELPFGRNTLFEKLREKGIFFKNRNEPKQEYIERGFFQLKEKFIERNNHDGFVVIKVLVTQKGLEFIANLFRAVPAQKLLATIE